MLTSCGMDILRREVESYIGASFVVLFAAFAVSIMLMAMKNFDSEITVLTATQTRIRTTSAGERYLMDIWIRENSIQIPDGQGYRWIIRTYPSHPWNP